MREILSSPRLAGRMYVCTHAHEYRQAGAIKTFVICAFNVFQGPSHAPM